MRALIAAVLLAATAAAADDGMTAEQLVRAAMDHWRGLSSRSEMTMTVHRPDWERSMTLRAWSEGDDHSLIRVTEPPRDAGNATLLVDKDMWTFSPKVNRIIKVPSSMMEQSWMGSDFSNKDVSKSTDIIDNYTHELTATEHADGHDVYVITSIPHEDAPVVWGKEVLRVRDDFVLLEEQYWDQDGALVKTLRTLDVAEMGGRAVARVMRMGKTDAPGEWTEMTVHEIAFDVDLPASVFTLSNLRNPRQ